MNARDKATIKLVNAAIAGDIPAIKQSLAEGAYLNGKPDNFISTALYYAVDNGKYEAAEYLLSAGAYAGVRSIRCGETFWNETPLFAAARSGHSDIVQLLCKYGARVNTDRHDTSTPLLQAVMSRNFNCVKVLLQNGADAKYFDKDKHSALYYAAIFTKSGDTFTLVELIDHLIATHQHDPLRLLTFLQTHDELKNAFERIESDEAAVQLFKLINFLLAKYISREEVNKLMPAKFQYIYDKLQTNKYSAEQTKILRNAAADGDMPAVLKALDAGADINGIPPGRIMPPLTGAVDSKRIDAAKLLLQRGANPEARTSHLENATALHYAVQHGDDDIVKLLLAYKINVNEQKTCGATALYMAACDGKIEIVKLLLSNGADAMILKGDVSPLEAAIVHGHGKCAELIIDNLIARHRSHPRALLDFLTNNDQLKYCFKHAKDSATFSAVLKLFFFVVGKEFDNDLLSKLLPSLHDIKDKIFFKSEILKALKTLPIKTRIAYCQALHGVHSDLATKYWIMADDDRRVIKDILDKATAELIAAEVADESVLVRKLYEAAAIGDTELAAIYLARGVNINATAGRNYETALFVAAANGHAAMVDLLILNGADISQQLQHGWKNYGKSALDIAVEREHIEVIRTIAKYRTDQSKKFCMYAVLKGTSDTPLKCTIKSGRVETAKVLLELGGMRPHYDSLDLCPLAYSVECNQPEMTNAIVDHMISTWKPDDVVAYMTNNKLIEHCIYHAARTSGHSYRAIIRLCDYLVANKVPHHTIIEHIKRTKYSRIRSLYINFEEVLFDFGSRLSPQDCVVYDNDLLDPNTFKGYLMTMRDGKDSRMCMEVEKRRISNTNVVLKDSAKTKLIERFAKEYDEAHPQSKVVEQPAREEKEIAAMQAPQPVATVTYPVIANISNPLPDALQKYADDGRKQQQQALAPVAVATVVQPQVKKQSGAELAFSSEGVPANLPEPMKPGVLDLVNRYFLFSNSVPLPPPLEPTVQAAHPAKLFTPEIVVAESKDKKSNQRTQVAIL